MPALGLDRLDQLGHVDGLPEIRTFDMAIKGAAQNFWSGCLLDLNLTA